MKKTKYITVQIHKFFGVKEDTYEVYEYCVNSSYLVLYLEDKEVLHISNRIINKITVVSLDV